MSTATCFISPFLSQPLKVPKTLTLIFHPQTSRSQTPQICPDIMLAQNKPTRRNPRKSSYGTSRRSINKKSFNQEQVEFTAPLSDDPEIGIVGGGMAGLICSLYLEKRGIRSTVFDTVRKDIGVNGMRPLAGSILLESHMVKVVRPCWISTLEPFNGMWHLSENGKPRGQFDAIVIAHNGKCANRLLSSSGLPLIAKQMKRLELSSIWALLAAFEDPLPLTVPFEGAFVKGIDILSWMANNSQKLSSTQSGPHCWTFFSTAAFGKQNKVPQENIPSITAEKVKTLMLEGVETALGLSKGSLKKPIYTKVQLWGAALPTNSPGVPCIFDPQGRAGICGDWLLGSSLETAALSGMAMANHIADYIQSGGVRSDEFAVGLHNEFQPIRGHDIGQFPGLEKLVGKAQTSDTDNLLT